MAPQPSLPPSSSSLCRSPLSSSSSLSLALKGLMFCENTRFDTAKEREKGEGTEAPETLASNTERKREREISQRKEDKSSHFSHSLSLFLEKVGPLRKNGFSPLLAFQLGEKRVRERVGQREI